MKALLITLPRFGSLAKRGSLAVLDQGVFAGTNFLVNILMARWLSPEHYGAFALAFSIFLFLSGFHNALVLEPMSILGPANYKHCPTEYLGSLLWIHGGVALGVALLLLSAAGVLTLLATHSPLVDALLGLGFGTPFILLLYLFRRAFYLQHRQTGALGSNLLYSTCVIIGFILLKANGGVTVFSVFLLIGLASLLASGVAYHCLTPCFSKESVALGLGLTRVLAENWHYGKWVVALTIVHWLSGNVYYVFTVGFLGFEGTGTLRALQNFVLPLSHAMTAAELVLLPWASIRLAERGFVLFKRDIVQISWLLTAFAAAYVLLLFFSAEPLMHTLYGAKYQDSAWLVPWFALASLISTLGSGCHLGLRIAQAPRAIFEITCIRAAVTVVLASVFVRLLGLQGIVLGMLISSASQVPAVFWYWRKTALQKTHGVLG